MTWVKVPLTFLQLGGKIYFKGKLFQFLFKRPSEVLEIRLKAKLDLQDLSE